MMIHADLGVPPWDVLSQGIQVQTGWSFGASAVLTSAFVLILWIPVKQQPGIGTFINALLIGPFADLNGPLMPDLESFPAKLVTLVLGVIVFATGSGLYISQNLGAGPRDGLMVGLTRVTGLPFWIIRTLGESVVLITGWLLGGTVGIGTALFAVSIGYLMQYFMKLFGFDPKSTENGVKLSK